MYFLFILFICSKATANLVLSIKSQADSQPDSEIQMRLLNAARILAHATTKMVEAAKGCASNPNDSKQQEILKRAAEDVRSATNVAAGNALRKKVVKRLEVMSTYEPDNYFKPKIIPI